MKGEYIVVLKDDVKHGDVAGIAKRLEHAHGGKVERVWEYALKGFFIRMTEGQAMGLSHDPDVDYIEENAEMYLSSRQPTNVDPANCDLPAQSNCSAELDDRMWHLDRIDQNLAVPSNNFGYCSDGSGVYVYVVDTGVWRGHSEFNNDSTRVLDGYNASGDGDYYPAYDPCHGPATLLPEDEETSQIQYFNEVFGASHGTAVGSMVAGRKVGIAKNAKIVPVKVARCGEDAARPLKRNRFYPVGMIVQANGSHYQVVQAGTTGPMEPQRWTWLGDPGCTMDGSACLQFIGFHVAQTVQMFIEGVDWILRPSNPFPKTPAVATFSTYRLVNDDATNPLPIPGRSTAISLEQAIRNLLAAGITVVASANNQNSNACDTTPARMSLNNPDAANAGDVITAGGSMILNNPDRLPAGFPNPATGGVANATEPAYDPSKPTLDARWRCGPGDSASCTQNGMAYPPPTPISPTNHDPYYTSTAGSNGGQCVTLFAPARNISVAQITGTTAYRDRRAAGGEASGTSWSAPLVAGVAARILQSHPTFTPAEVRDLILENAFRNVLDPLQLDPPGVAAGTTPNILLHTGDVFIDNQPVVTPGPSTTTIHATVHASTLVTYQWYRVNPEFNLALYPRAAAAATPINSASAVTDTLSISTPTTRTGYMVRVTSDCATTDSDIVIVDPCSPPSITAQPTSRTITGGQTTTLTAGASGLAPLSYQWYIGASGNTSSPIPNATGPSVSVAPSANTSYWVRVSNACGSANSNTAVVTVNHGAGFHQKTPVDFNGDHISDVVMYRHGTWIAYNQNNGAELWRITTDSFGDGIPLAMDYDGDGRSEFTIFRPGVAWYFYNDNGSLLKSISIPLAGAKPAPADYDGDGLDDVVVYRNGTWTKYDFNTGAAVWSITTDSFGDGLPVPMDFDGDGRAEFTVWRPGLNWHFYNEDGTYVSGIWIGLSDAVPAPGDYDGNGTEDAVVFNRANPSWLFYNISPAQYVRTVGTPGGSVDGDPIQPAPLDYDGDGSADMTYMNGGPWDFWLDNGSLRNAFWTGGNVGDLAMSRRLHMKSTP